MIRLHGGWAVVVSLLGAFAVPAAQPYSLRPTLLQGGQGDANSVVLSPDGKTLAVAGGSTEFPGFVRLYDVAQRKVIQTIVEPFGVISVAFSADGGKLAWSGSSEKVTVRDIATGEDLYFMTVPGVTRLAFSPDGKYLATPTRPGQVRLWDAGTGKELARLETDLLGCECVAFSPDSKTLAVGGGVDGDEGAKHELALFDVTTRKSVGILEGHKNAVFGVAFSPDGQKVAAGNRDGKVLLWTVADGKLFKTLEGHTATSEGIAFSPDGRLMVSAGQDGTVRLWDAATGEARGELIQRVPINHSAVFSGDSRTLYVGGGARTVTAWDVVTRKQTATLQGPENSAGDSAVSLALAMRSDGKSLALAGEDHAIRLRDPVSGDNQAVLHGHTDAVLSIAFTPNGKSLASGSADRTIRLWSADGKPGHVLKGHEGWVTVVAYSPDGKQLASASYDRTIRLWNVEMGEESARLVGHTAAVRCLAFAPDGKTLASAGNDGTIRLWDTTTLKSRLTLDAWPPKEEKKEPTEAVLALVFAPDGKSLASGGEGSSVQIWDPHSGKKLADLNDGQATVHALAFTPDNLLIGGSNDGMVHVWTLKHLAQVADWKAHDQAVTGLTIDPLTKSVVTTGRDIQIKKWASRQP